MRKWGVVNEYIETLLSTQIYCKSVKQNPQTDSTVYIERPKTWSSKHIIKGEQIWRMDTPLSSRLTIKLHNQDMWYWWKTIQIDHEKIIETPEKESHQ